MASQNPSAATRETPRLRSGTARSGVIHVNTWHTRRFTVVGNHLLQHPGLSAMAIGLAAHIQSLPEGAPVGVKVLAGRFPEGEIRIAAALRELERHGYLERRRERLASGRVVTRTYFHNKPGAAGPDEGGPGHPPRGGPEAGVPDHRAVGRPDGPPPDGAVLVGAVPGAAASDAQVPGAQVPDGAVFVGLVRDAAASDAPVSDGPVTRAEASGVPVLDRPGTPGAAGVPRVHRPPPEPQFAPGPVPAAPAFPLAAPEAAPPHPAAELLAGLRRRDPRLLLAERDVARLAPGVAAWLGRGLDAEAVARALSRDLPEPLRNPAGVLAYRLGALLPPRLPPLPGPAARPHPDRITYPMQNCDGCDRGFRAPEPGRCGDCPQVAA
ncbi:helix-turn-helix domain-containing protein [Streptomyces sp. NPDC008265]|uniref:helix-turn-helix domain-containing protein n=1 Tax=Streptomyces sp. NPDC008265 TaxID=3364824 RepID=UPI0036EB5D4B